MLNHLKIGLHTMKVEVIYFKGILHSVEESVSLYKTFAV